MLDPLPVRRLHAVASSRYFLEATTRSVLVVDDDAGFRALLCALLEGAGYATREEASGEGALAALREEASPVVILDVRLPGICGYEVCRELRDEFGERIGVMFLSGERTESFDRAAGLYLGGDDYLVKPFAPDELLAQVDRLFRRVAPAADAASELAATLSERELEILRLAAEGTRQAEIADRLVISPRTVGRHIEHIHTKLGVHSRAEAVAFAYRHGLVGIVLAGLAL